MKTTLFASAAALISAASHSPTGQYLCTDGSCQTTCMIEEINNTPGVLWTAGSNYVPINKRTLGVNMVESRQMLEKSVALGATLRAPGGNQTFIPDSFDSATNWPHCAKLIGDIRDQSNCGCCWAFAAAEAASDRLCIYTQGKMMFPLSAQELCFCASSNGCYGGDLFTPWSYIQERGLVTGGQVNGTGPFGKGMCSDFSMPHCHHHGPQGKDPYPAEGQPGCPSQTSAACPTRCDSNSVAPHNDFSNDAYTFDGLVMHYPDADAIAEEIMKNGPVETAFTVYEDFASYTGGIYHHVSGQMEGGHAVKIVGWGEDNGTKYWKIANSWNPYWGEEGYFRIVRGTDECGIESQVTASSTDAKWQKMKN